MKNSAPFFGMIVGAFDMLKIKWRGVFIAVITFAMLSGVFSAFVQRQIDTIETLLASRFNLTRDEFDDRIVSDLSSMSSLEMNELMLELANKSPPFFIIDKLEQSQKNIGFIYVSHVAPYIGLLVLLNCIIFFIAYTYFLLLFSRGTLSPYEAAALLPKAVFGQIALSFLIGFRSLLWIPIAGPFFAVYFLPRLALAPVMYASGETGMVQSIKRSMERSSKRWLTIVLRFVGLLLTLTLCLWPVLVMTAAIGIFSLKLSYIFWLASLVAFIAFFSAAHTMLVVMLS